MPNYRQANIKGAAYFFTVMTYRRQNLLCNENVRKALRDGIRNTQTTHPFTIDVWVLLYDRLHCIRALPSNDANFGIRWAMRIQTANLTSIFLLLKKQRSGRASKYGLNP